MIDLTQTEGTIHMAGSNFRIISGNGILSGGLLATDVDPDDLSTSRTAAYPFGVQSQLAGRRMGYGASNIAPPSYGDTPSWMTPWPPAVAGAAESAGGGTKGVPLASGGLPTASPFARADQSGFLNSNRFAPSPSRPLFASFTSGGSLPVASTIPIGYADSTRPWWAPAPGPFGPWEKQYQEGMSGLYNYLRGLGSRAGTSSGDDDFCYNRWEKEDARCGQFYPFGVRYYQACKTRASDRRNLCIRNGGKPNPDEPDEYDWKDIPPEFPRP